MPIRIVQGASGVADKVYICVKLANNSYAWIDLLAFKFGV